PILGLKRNKVSAAIACPVTKVDAKHTSVSDFLRTFLKRAHLLGINFSNPQHEHKWSAKFFIIPFVEKNGIAHCIETIIPYKKLHIFCNKLIPVFSSTPCGFALRQTRIVILVVYIHYDMLCLVASSA
ncbi:hypothetical protein, partial [Brevibacillus agri]|uniref:hypothetical protein n=1 Tax=Brevibacillus agri TaxID=51101 RepID=UPI003D19D999